jgi:hypothetical protein
METQAQSRLAVLRRAFVAKELRGAGARRPSSCCSVTANPGSSSIFGGIPAFAPGGRMFTVLLCTDSRRYSRVRGGKQEGIL